MLPLSAHDRFPDEGDGVDTTAPPLMKRRARVLRFCQAMSEVKADRSVSMTWQGLQASRAKACPAATLPFCAWAFWAAAARVAATINRRVRCAMILLLGALFSGGAGNSFAADVPGERPLVKRVVRARLRWYWSEL